MKYYLGVDQGGTKTTAILGDDSGHIHGIGIEKGLVSCYHADKQEVFIRHIHAACQQAVGSTEIQFADVSSVCGCLNGADWDFEYPYLAKALIRATGCRQAAILNDCIGAMRGGSPSAECAVICAGTGLNAAVRREDGKMVIYGYYVNEADQGGSALGKAAFHKMIDSFLGIGNPTILTGMILGQTGHESVEKLMMEFSLGKYQIQFKDFARLLLLAYAEGDHAAMQIVEQFVHRVSQYVICGMKKLDIAQNPIELVFSGSVFKDDGTMVTQKITEFVQQQIPNLVGINAKYEPVCGAFLTLLDQRYGRVIPEAVMKNFERDAVNLGLTRNTVSNKTRAERRSI